MPVELIYSVVKACLAANELGGDMSLAYKFSDPDGLRTGKSGYSFGLVQFDIENNWLGLHCLEDCGFMPKDLKRLFAQQDDISDLDARLKASAWKVDEYDIQHIHESISHCKALLEESKIRLLDASALIHIVDYHNQFFMSPGGKLHHFLGRAGSIDAAGMLHFKLEFTAWGAKRPDDVRRRWENIERIVRQSGLKEVFV